MSAKSKTTVQLTPLKPKLSGNDYMIEKPFEKSRHVAKESRRSSLVESILLVWLDTGMNESDKDFSHSLIRLRQIVHTIKTYTNIEKCMSFLKNIEDEKAFMIVSGSVGQQIIGGIHNMPQIDSIYVFCNNVLKHQQWAKEWPKVKCVHGDIRLICDAIKKNARQCERDSMAIRIVDTTDINQLDPTFMYTGLFKEILLELEYNQQSMETLVEECRKRYEGNDKELQVIREFEEEYYNHSPIWWYTRECFTYNILNRALRTFEVDIILFMGVFIRHLHHRIEQLHSKQKHTFKTQFIVYRGQGLSKKDFDSLEQSHGGLLAFNSFLSTSLNRQVSYNFACEALNKFDHVAILFRMTIHSSIPTARFAVLGKESYFEESEQEILFSMNSVFRIGQLKKLDKEKLFEVELTLTIPEADDKLHKLTQQIRSEIAGPTPIHRMAHLLRISGYPKKAQEFYQSLLAKTPAVNYEELSHLNQMLGQTYLDQNQNDDAILFLKKAIEMRENFLSHKHLDIATSYDKLGTTFEAKGEYVKALQYYGKSLELREKYIPQDKIHLAELYINIGRMHQRLGELSRAEEYYTKVLDIRQKSLPPTHPDLAMAYNNLGTLYADMGELMKASDYMRKAYKMFKNSLLPYHIHMMMINYNLGLLSLRMGENAQGFEFLEKGLKIADKVLPKNDPELSANYDMLGSLYFNMEHSAKALEHSKKALDLRKKSSSTKDCDLAISYHNVGIMYDSLGESKKALEYLQKAIQMDQKVTSPNYANMAISYRSIVGVYQRLQEPVKVIEFAEKFIEMQEKSLSPNHPDLIGSYEFVIEIYDEMKEHSKTLHYLFKIQEILKKTSINSCSSNLALNYLKISTAYTNMDEPDKAFHYHEKSMEMQEKLPNPEKDILITMYALFINACELKGEYLKGLKWNQKLLEFAKKSTPTVQSILVPIYQQMGELYFSIKNYPVALEFYQKTIEKMKQNFPIDYVELLVINYRISEVYFEMGEYTNAHAAAKNCFDIQQTSPGLAAHKDVVLFSLGRLYYFMKNYTAAISYFVKAADLAKIAVPETDQFFGLIYSNMGNAQQLAGDHQNAWRSFQKALQVQENIECTRRHLAQTYIYMGEMYRRTRNYSVALELFGKALKVQEKFTPSPHPDVAVTYHHTAQVYKDMGQSKLAFEHAQQALDKARQTLPETHPLSVKLRQAFSNMKYHS